MHQASTQPVHRDETLSKRDRWELSKRGLERKLDPAFVQAHERSGRWVFGGGPRLDVRLFPETVGFSTTTLQVPDVFVRALADLSEESGARRDELVWCLSKARGAVVDRDSQRYARQNHHPDDDGRPLLWRSNYRWTPPAQTVNETCGALSRRPRGQSPPRIPVSSLGPDPLDLAAIAARFLPPPLGTSHHPSSTAPILLDPSLGPTPLLSGPHTCLPSNWTSPWPRRLLGVAVGGRPL